VKVGDVTGGHVHVHHHPPSWFGVEARVEELFTFMLSR